MKGEELVSIVMPAYNVEKYIEESIESVLYQTYLNWELIIVNDCSLDNTYKIIKKYHKKDSRIKSYSLLKIRVLQMQEILLLIMQKVNT